ncbi:unnamed protein product [Blepharisma stoltei]|uniref:Uncharacterized protein n=1 Tax=Blepharisma stoltei TaxID=1481888 RepID=A0AAU9K7D6_9CILI|nr:unnamed protein product [Blepharisma stoltei]
MSEREAFVRARVNRMMEVRRQENELGRKSSQDYSGIKKASETSDNLRKTYIEKLEQINALMRERENALALIGKAHKDAEDNQMRIEKEQRERQIFLAESKKKARERGINALRVEQENAQAKVDEEIYYKKRREEILQQEYDKAHKVAEDYRAKQKIIEEQLRREAEENFIRPGGQVIRGEIDYSKTHFHNPIIVKHDLAEISAMERAQQEAELEQRKLYHQEGIKIMQEEKAKNRGEEALYVENIEKEYKQMITELEKLKRADGEQKIEQGISDSITQNRCIITDSQINKRKQQEMEVQYEKIFKPEPVKEKTRMTWNLKEKKEIIEENPQKSVSIPKVDYIPTVSQEISSSGQKKIVIQEGPSNDPFESLKNPLKYPAFSQAHEKKASAPKLLIDSPEKSESEGSEASEDENEEEDYVSSESSDADESLSAKYNVYENPDYSWKNVAIQPPQKINEKIKDDKKEVKPPSRGVWEIKENKDILVPEDIVTEIKPHTRASWKVQDREDLRNIHASIKEEPQLSKPLRNNIEEPDFPPFQEPKSFQITKSEEIASRNYSKEKAQEKSFPEQFEEVQFSKPIKEATQKSWVQNPIEEIQLSKPSRDILQQAPYQFQSKEDNEVDLKEDPLFKITEKKTTSRPESAKKSLQEKPAQQVSSRPQEKQIKQERPQERPQEAYQERKAQSYETSPIAYPSFPVYTPIPVMPVYPYPTSYQVPSFPAYLNPAYPSYPSQISPQFNQNFSQQPFLSPQNDPPSLASSQISALSMSPPLSSSIGQKDMQSPITSPSKDNQDIMRSPVSLLSSSPEKEEELGQTSFFPTMKPAEKFDIYSKVKTEFTAKPPEDFEESHNEPLKPRYGNGEKLKKSESWDFDFDKVTSKAQPKKREIQTSKPVVMDFSDDKGKSLAEIFKEKKSKTLEHLAERDPKPVKAEKKEKTKEELFEIRKNLLKHQKSKEETKKEALAEQTSIKHPKGDLMERLASGQKVKVNKRDMKKLTEKNYELLPEVKKRKEEEKKKQEQAERRQRAREFEKKRQETRFKSLNKYE